MCKITIKPYANALKTLKFWHFYAHADYSKDQRTSVCFKLLTIYVSMPDKRWTFIEVAAIFPKWNLPISFKYVTRNDNEMIAMPGYMLDEKNFCC